MTPFKLESNRDNQFYLKLIEMIIPYFLFFKTVIKV